MYELLNDGLLGHTLPAAENLPDALQLTTRPGKWAVRFKTCGSKTVFGLEAHEALAMVRNLPDGSYNLSPMLSDPHRVCYGHLLVQPDWFLHYSPDPKPCKLVPSMDGCAVCYLNGLQARMYLRGIMDDIGWATLLELVEQYPDHVIEFTVMAGAAWAFGPSNTIIWEVRCTTGEYERNSGWRV
jgi:hypothetical protein